MPETRLIDADKAIAEIKRIYCDDCDSHNGVMCRACGYQDAMDIIDDSPTVDAVPVNRWHWEQSASGELYCCYCQYVPQWEDDKFCANCGAKMDGGDADA